MHYKGEQTTEQPGEPIRESQTVKQFENLTFATSHLAVG